ncbi:MAG: quinone-dependent dihydroorotate dehydrogenase [bacterium]
MHLSRDVYSLIRPLLFSLGPETSHDLVLSSLAAISRSRIACSLLGKLFSGNAQPLPTRVMGVNFPNPVGLAAGLDKQGNCANALSKLGFGWVELGTVTPLPQPGNSKPRMFRLTPHQAIINRMGFNSIGLEQFLGNIRRIRPGIVTGINIGKNAATPVEQAPSDYLRGLEAVYLHADYITINISSPNTSNLRTLQQDDALDDLLGQIILRRQQLSDTHGRYVPLVLKIAPDLNATQVQSIAAQLRKHKLDGVAATNTTVSRQAVSQHPDAKQDGGLSGAPLREMSTQVVRSLYQNLQGEIPIMGIGGIDSVHSAFEKFEAGANLVQIYTGFIFKGPGLITDIVKDLSGHCESRDFAQFVNTLHLKSA